MISSFTLIYQPLKIFFQGAAGPPGATGPAGFGGPRVSDTQDC